MYERSTSTHIGSSAAGMRRELSSMTSTLATGAGWLLQQQRNERKTIVVGQTPEPTKPWIEEVLQLPFWLVT